MKNREGWTVRSAAWRVLRGNTLGIKTDCALSERAPSGPDGFDPATSSPCQAWVAWDTRGSDGQEDFDGGQGTT